MSTTSQLPAAIAERYTRTTALRHERLYGHGYQGPGSREVFEQLAARVDPHPGRRVLDVGSGLGGDAFRLAATYGVEVVGLDAAPDMTAVCRERQAAEGSDRVTFVTGNVLTADVVAPDSFDLVWTRDAGAFLTVPEKLVAWRRLHAALRPGGDVLVTDYCIGPSSTAAFRDQMVAWGQHMITPAEYADVLASARFADVVVEDRTGDLMDSMLQGRATMLRDRAMFLAELSEQDYAALLGRWEQKIGYGERGELVWMVLTARATG
jgi:phosphoethanolamine N-methyltransferase